MNLPLTVEIPRQLTDLAVDQIREAIVDGRLQLGQMISESALAASFGISKTPVREALVRLQREGLVVIQPRRGTFVFRVDEAELVEICDCRLTLETTALRLAFQRRRDDLCATLATVTAAMDQAWENNEAAQYRRLDTAFHQTFFDLCENRYVAGCYELIASKMAALRNRLSSRPDHVRKSYVEHVRMARLLADGDLDAAITILEGHIGRRQGSYWMTDDAVRS